MSTIRLEVVRKCKLYLKICHSRFADLQERERGKKYKQTFVMAQTSSNVLIIIIQALELSILN